MPVRPVRARKTSSRRAAHAEVVECDTRPGELAHGVGEPSGAVVDGHGDTPVRFVDPHVLVAERCKDLGGAGEVAAFTDPDFDHVPAGPALELFGRARCDRAPVVDDHDVIGQLVGLLQVLRGHQHVRAAGNEVTDRRPQLHPTARVEAGRRLVEQQQPRRADEAGTQVEAPTHPAGVRAHETVAGVAQPELLEDSVGGISRGTPAVAEQPGDHLEVLPTGQRRFDGGELTGQPDHPAHLLGAGQRIDAGDAQQPGVGAQQRGDGAHERRLSGAVGAEDRRDGPGRSDQLEAVEGGDVILAALLPEVLAQPGGLDDRNARGVLAWWRHVLHDGQPTWSTHDHFR